jgi:Domain of unknown function (DUF4145)
VPPSPPSPISIASLAIGTPAFVSPGVDQLMHWHHVRTTAATAAVSGFAGMLGGWHWIEAHAFAVLVRRLLEMICLDKGAQGRNLFEQLKFLVQTGVIPRQLIDIANGLRNFGNIGAHAAGVQLSENEVPVIDALCRAILEYVYGAPHLVALAQQTLDKGESERAPESTMNSGAPRLPSQG